MRAKTLLQVLLVMPLEGRRRNGGAGNTGVRAEMGGRLEGFEVGRGVGGA